MKLRSSIFWLIILTVLGNTGLNLFTLYNLSRIYTINDDFRPDIVSISLLGKLEEAHLKIPPVKIIKFFSADIYKPSQVVFTGDTLYILMDMVSVGKLSDSEMEAVLAHEVGHYVLGHLNYRLPDGDVGFDGFKREMEADSFAAKYEGNEAIVSAVKKLVWNENEKKIRLAALGVY